MVTKKEYLCALHIVKAYQEQIKNEFQEVTNEVVLHPEMNISEVSFSIVSVRLRNCLGSLGYYCRHGEGGALFQDLETLSFSKFKNHRNVGKKTIEELLQVCAKAGIKLKP
jgi:DNA-directed RNA polymerase alpha subunit